VGHDENGSGNREFFSNWNANGNSTTSIFLGLTNGRLVRFSDQFRSTRPVGAKPFILTAVSGQEGVQLFLGRNLIGERNGGLSGRNLSTPYVIGTQGNFGREYQKGWLAELIVFDHGLVASERERLWSALEKKYPSLKTVAGVRSPGRPKRNAELLAWASLCHVLLNANETIFVD